MDYSETPHACFKVESASIARANDELPRMLAHHLHARLNSARVRKTPLLASWTIHVGLDQESSFTVILGRSKYEKDEWILLVGPSQTPGLLDLMRGRKSVGYSPGLMRICREIHAFLARVSGFTAIRWYFQGFRSQSTAVATPDELPWSKT